MSVGWDVQQQGKLWELLWVGGKAVVQCEATAPPKLWGAMVAQCPIPAVCPRTVCAVLLLLQGGTFSLPAELLRLWGCESFSGWALQETCSFLKVSTTKSFSVSLECPQLASHPLPSNPVSLWDVRVCRSPGWGGRRDPRNGSSSQAVSFPDHQHMFCV